MTNYREYLSTLIELHKLDIPIQNYSQTSKKQSKILNNKLQKLWKKLSEKEKQDFIDNRTLYLTALYNKVTG